MDNYVHAKFQNDLQTKVFKKQLKTKWSISWRQLSVCHCQHFLLHSKDLPLYLH